MEVQLLLYLGSAGGAGAAAAFMAGSGARVAAVWTGQCARLLAAALSQTLVPVADPSTAVEFTRQLFVTCQATRNVLQMTGNVAALLHSTRKG